MAAVIRLEWHRDSLGYEIVPVERKRRAGVTILEGGDSDDLGDPSHPWDTPEAWGYCINGKGGALKSFVLEGVDRRVFLKLANTPFTFDGVLGFVNDWGLPLTPCVLGQTGHQAA